MKAEYAITVANALVADLTAFVTAHGLPENLLACLCRARTLQELIAEELKNRKTWNANRDARQFAAGREKGKPGRRKRKP